MAKSDYYEPVLPEFYKDCADITERYEKLWGRWQPDSQLLHVISEVCELQDVLRNKKSKYGEYGSVEFTNALRNELADVFLTSFATANYLGLSIEDLNSAILLKLDDVEKRLIEEESKN